MNQKSLWRDPGFIAIMGASIFLAFVVYYILVIELPVVHYQEALIKTASCDVLREHLIKNDLKELSIGELSNQYIVRCVK